MHERISGGAGSGKTHELVKRAREFSGEPLLIAPTSYLASWLGMLSDLPSTTPAGLAEEIIRAVRPEIEEVISKEKKSRFSSLREYEERLKLGSPVSLCGEQMKSFGETDVANFLFSSKIDYVYEAPYEKDTRTGERSQYRPDFYLPEYGVYIEYFAVDEEGNVPAYFGDGEEYLRDMEWKFDLHEREGTKLIPLYAYERSDGVLIKNLTAHLKKLGVKRRKRSKKELYPKVPEREVGTEKSELEKKLAEAARYVKEGRYVCPYERIFVDDIAYMGEAARALIGALGVGVTFTETEGESARQPEVHFIFSFTERGMARQIASVLDKLSRERVFIIGRAKNDADVLLCERNLKPHYDRSYEYVRVKYLKKPRLDISYFTASATVGRECDVAFVLSRGFDEDDRALFELALTRARRAVYIVSKTGDEPTLAREIREEAGVPEKKGFACPKCGAPFVLTKGRYGEFLRCKKCGHKKRI